MPSVERCIHDLAEGQCTYCKPVPFGINSIVYSTKGGDCFHNWHECLYLAAGQDFAYSKGFNNHAINPTSWGAVKDFKSPCQWCCAIYLAGKENLDNCKALIDGGWLDALLAKSSYGGPGRRIHQVLVPQTGLVYFLSNKEVKI